MKSEVSTAPSSIQNTVPTETVQLWTVKFLQLADEKKCFAKISRKLEVKNRDASLLIGAAWYQFSDFMPWFLSRAAAEMRDNYRRHYLIKVAYEELGEGSVSEIHSELFIKSAAQIGLAIDRTDSANTKSTLNILRHSLLNTDSDSFILGMSLGLEIVAYENITTLFEGISYDEILKRQLRDTTFFKTHFVNEEMHINLTVSNFVRFCSNEKERKEFMAGFNVSLCFWTTFWNNVANQIDQIEFLGRQTL